MAVMWRVGLSSREGCLLNSERAFLRCLLSLSGVVLLAACADAAENRKHALFTNVLKDHVVDGVVDYAAIKKDKRFDEYLAGLSRTDPAAIANDADRLAFWINAYNAFTIKLVNDHLPVKSIRNIQKDGMGPWDIVWIAINGREYNLNQIEHDVIRKEFDEPRIHMALVCAARSCPPLRSEAYEGVRLDEQLEDNSRIFLHDTSKNWYDKETNTLHLSELFKWYGEDFVTRHGSAEEFALGILGISRAKGVTVKYAVYDWDLNGK